MQRVYANILRVLVPVIHRYQPQARSAGGTTNGARARSARKNDHENVSAAEKKVGAKIGKRTMGRVTRGWRSDVNGGGLWGAKEG